MGELSIHSVRYSLAEGSWFKSIEPVRPVERISADRIPHGGGESPGRRGQMERLSRRSFMKIAGAATGAAALAAAPPMARAAIGEEGAVKTDPTTRVPEEPVVAYVRDAARGEVTVTSGTTEHTYRDRALVQKLMRAAGRKGAI
jgi:hypothetical protein